MLIFVNHPCILLFYRRCLTFYSGHYLFLPILMYLIYIRYISFRHETKAGRTKIEICVKKLIESIQIHLQSMVMLKEQREINKSKRVTSFVHRHRSTINFYLMPFRAQKYPSVWWIAFFIQQLFMLMHHVIFLIKNMVAFNYMKYWSMGVMQTNNDIFVFAINVLSNALA